MVNVSKVRQAQKILEEALVELKTETCNMIEKSQPLSGVTILSENTAYVSFSTLVSNNNWSPSTYLPIRQIEAVKYATKNITNFDSFVYKIKELIEKKEVKIKNKTIHLNSNTLKALNCVLDELS